jgi:hypothetical protein
MKFQNSVFFSLFVAGILPGQAAYVWLGTSTGLTDAPNTSLGGDGDSVYAEANWDDDSIVGPQAAPANSINNSTQSPAGINSAVIITYGGVAGGINGGGSNTAHFRSNGNAITISGAGSGLKLAISLVAGPSAAAAWVENDATIGGSRSSLSISSGGFLSTGALRDIAASVSGSGSSLWFISNGNNGLTGNNSTIDLTGGTWASSAILNWASMTAGQLFTAGVLSSLTVDGAAGVWGSDPLVYEEGDNLLASSVPFTRNGTKELPQNNWYDVTRSGFRIIAVPEPGSALLGLLGAFVLLGRRNNTERKSSGIRH